MARRGGLVGKRRIAPAATGRRYLFTQPMIRRKDPVVTREVDPWRRYERGSWSPKYFPPQLVQYANTLLKDRILFGSDFPLITPDRWLADFEEAGFKDAVRRLKLGESKAEVQAPAG